MKAQGGKGAGYSVFDAEHFNSGYPHILHFYGSGKSFVVNLGESSKMFPSHWVLCPLRLLDG